MKKKPYVYIIFFLLMSPLLGFMPFNEQASASESILVRRGVTWNEYMNQDGTYTKEISGQPINYQDGTVWKPINTTMYVLPTGHYARTYGYIAGNEHGLFSVFFKQSSSSDYPIAFVYNKTGDSITHVLRTKLLGFAYIDPSQDFKYHVFQNIGTVNGYISTDKTTVRYDNIIPGVNLSFKYTNRGLKEEITLTPTIKTYLQNHPPSSYGLSNTQSYVAAITQLEYLGLDTYNGTIIKNNNFTVGELGTIFKDIAGDIQFTLPIGDVYTQNNQRDTSRKMVSRFIKYNGNSYLASGIKATELNSMTFPVVYDPTVNYGEYNLQNGYTEYSGSDWNTLHSHDWSFIHTDSIQAKAGIGYEIYRGLAFFDTTSLNPYSIVSSATISFTVDTIYTGCSMTDNGIIVGDSTHIYPGNSIDVGDFTFSHYNVYCANFTPATSTSYNLSLVNLYPINPGGVTGLCFMERKHDWLNVPSDGCYWWYTIGNEANVKLWVTYNILSVFTNASTNVEETTARLNGYVTNTSGYNPSTVWFQYGTTTSYGTNTTKQLKNEGQSFYRDIGSMPSPLTPGTIYHTRAVMNNSLAQYFYGNDVTFATKPEQPTTLSIDNTLLNCTLNISWIKGIGTYHTIILRNDTGWSNYPNTVSNGTVVYDGTSTYYIYNLTSYGYKFYFRAWSSNNSIYSDLNSSCWTYTVPATPINITATKVGSDVNISWVKGRGADKTILLRKIGSYPSSWYDASATELYNGTGTYSVTSVTLDAYYALFSFNTSNGTHSISGYSSFLGFGLIGVNCFNESSGLPIYFDVLVTNNDGSKTYIETDLYGYTLIPTSLTPQGDGVALLFSSHYNNSNFSSRLYFLDITPGETYNLSGYLARIYPPLLLNTSYPYLIKIINIYNNPVEQVHIIVKGIIGGTGNFTVISDGYTDASGGFTVYLIPSKLYKIFISKTGYISGVQNMLPDPIFYGLNYPTTYYLYATPVEEAQLFNNIVFTIEPYLTSFQTGFNVYYNITSSDNQLEYYVGTVSFYNSVTNLWTTLYTSNVSSSVGGSISYSVPNISGSYSFVCSFKKTGFSLFSTTMYYSIWYYPDSSASDLDDMITHIAGKSPVFISTVSGDVIVSWTALIASFAVMFVMFTFSPKFAGLSIMAVGAVLGVFKEPLNLISNTVLNWVAVGCIIILGLLLTIESNKEK